MRAYPELRTDFLHQPDEGAGENGEDKRKLWKERIRADFVSRDKEIAFQKRKKVRQIS